MQVINPTFVFWSLEGRCYGNQFLEQFCRKLPRHPYAQSRIISGFTGPILTMVSSGIGSQMINLTYLFDIWRDVAMSTNLEAKSPTSPSFVTHAVLLAARLPQCAVKWDRNLKPKLAIMRQCTSVKDRRTDGQRDGHWHHSISARCIYYISR